MKKYSDFIWVEKFRPKNVKEVVLPSSLKKQFEKLIKEKKIPNLLFYSSTPGSGKTSLAKALCNDIKAEYIYINTSSEGGIDTLRSTISKFASAKSLSGKQKVVILDEFDGASKNLQQGLRAAIEEFHKVCRFIFTCNFITQIIEPLRSRCQEFDMNFLDKKTIKELKPLIFKRIIGILKFQKVNYDVNTIKKLINTKYPDIRKIIQLCHQYSNVNDCIDNEIFNFEKIDDEFYNYIINKDFKNARKFIIEKNYNYIEMYTNLYRELVPRLENSLRPQVIIILAEYQYKHAHVIDQEINFAACLLEIMNTL